MTAYVQPSVGTSDVSQTAFFGSRVISRPPNSYFVAPHTAPGVGLKASKLVDLSTFLTYIRSL